MQALQFSIAVVEEDESVRLGVCSLLQKLGISAWGVGSTDDLYAGFQHEQNDLVFTDPNVIVSLATQRRPMALLTLRGKFASLAVKANALQCFVPAADLRAIVDQFGLLTASQTRSSPLESSTRATALWHLDSSAAHLIAPNRHSVSLTGRELDLLDCLISSNQRMVSKQALLEVMGYTRVDNGFHRIESQLARLRSKTLRATGMPLPIRAIFGRGLIFVANKHATADPSLLDDCQHQLKATSSEQSM